MNTCECVRVYVFAQSVLSVDYHKNTNLRQNGSSSLVISVVIIIAAVLVLPSAAVGVFVVRPSVVVFVAASTSASALNLLYLPLCYADFILCVC